MDGGEGKIGIKGCVVKGIEHQQETKRKKYWTTEDGEVRSSMSVNRSKQCIKEWVGDLSYVSKTI